MRQQLSELMDGELDIARRENALRTIAADPELRENWHAYHLIGDCLRGDLPVADSVCGDSTDRIFLRLAEEPAILAPRRRHGAGAVSTNTRIALALAASVATLSVLGVIVLRERSVSAPPLQMARQAAPVDVPPAARLAAQNPNVNDYLMLHRQFANPDAIQQAAVTRDARKPGTAR